MGGPCSGLTEIRTFNPQAMTQPLAPNRAFISVIETGEAIRLHIDGGNRYVLEWSDDLGAGEWKALSAPLTERDFTFEKSGAPAFIRARLIE